MCHGEDADRQPETQRHMLAQAQPEPEQDEHMRRRRQRMERAAHEFVHALQHHVRVRLHREGEDHKQRGPRAALA